MSLSRQKIGQYAEQSALDYLQQQGLNLLQRNFHSRYGEIDLIMLDADCVCFVEVRARLQGTYGDALESVTPQKQQKIILTAQHFLQKNLNYEQFDCRFDVIAIDYVHKINTLSEMMQQSADLQWIKHAYTM